MSECDVVVIGGGAAGLAGAVALLRVRRSVPGGVDPGAAISPDPIAEDLRVAVGARRSVPA